MSIEGIALKHFSAVPKILGHEWDWRSIILASFYIPAIQKLAFCLTHVRKLGTNHCGEMRCTASKRRESFQDILCRYDYAERVVANFTHQIQSEYYG